MFKDGFILNYYAGAKGDFLLRFLSNVKPSINQTGQTSHTLHFSTIRNKEHYIKCFTDKANRLKVYNEIMPDYILSMNTVWPYVTHALHNLTDENLLKIQSKFHNIYDLIVEEDFYKEIFINDIFKNFSHELNKKEIIEIKEKINSDFNGKFFIDQECFLKFDRTQIEYDDEFRIKFLQEYVDSFDDYKIWLNKYKQKQLSRNTNKIYFSKLFHKPYSDLINLYTKLNNKEPDIDLFEKLLSKTYVPEEIIFFNHKIRISYESDNIIEVLGKVQE